MAIKFGDFRFDDAGTVDEAKALRPAEFPGNFEDLDLGEAIRFPGPRRRRRRCFRAPPCIHRCLHHRADDRHAAVFQMFPDRTGRPSATNLKLLMNLASIPIADAARLVAKLNAGDTEAAEFFCSIFPDGAACWLCDAPSGAAPT